MFKVKVRKIGNSLGAILPSEVAARLRVREGDNLSMTETADGIQLSPYDPDFEAVMSAFERGRKRYRNALRRSPEVGGASVGYRSRRPGDTRN
jgi:putative addiction module antidote